jgi:hypothetical protein
VEGDHTGSERQDARLDLIARYLSDEIAPMIFLDAVDDLLEAPPPVVGLAVRGWLVSQLRGAPGVAISDYLYHAVKKLHLLGELELVPAPELAAFLRGVFPEILKICPDQERAALVQNLEHIGSSETSLASRVEVLHRPAGGTGSSAGTSHPGAGAGGSGGGQPAAGGPAGGAAAGAPMYVPVAGAASGTATGAGVPQGTVALPISVVEGLGRLNLLLDRFDQTPPAGTARITDAGLLAGIATEMAAVSHDGAELDGRLLRLQELGGSQIGTSVLRLLGRSLPDWAPPPGEIQPFGAVRAMQKIINLAQENEETQRRFSELVSAAVEQFNEGALGRSVTMLDLAQRMVDDEDVDATIVKAVVGQVYPNLDHVQLRAMADSEEKHPLLRRVMGFFPQLGPEELLLELEVEPKRDRRRTLISLLTVHGTTARTTVFAALRDGISGARQFPWHFERNLLYLLRSIPRSVDEPLDAEIDVLVHLSDPGGPLAVVREALAGLSQISHDRVDTTLAARMSELEDALTGARELPHKEEELRGLLDSIVVALARTPTAAARRAVVSHGLKRRGVLGDTLGRLARLGTQNLSDDPQLVERLLAAVRAELPTKVFGFTVTTPRRAQAIDHLIQALAGTDTPAVRQLLTDLAGRFAGQPFAEPAARTLAQLGTAVQEEERPTASLSGDLKLFGLPNLLQNLSDSQVSGVLTLFDDDGGVSASMVIDRGALRDARAGALVGDTALYQLLERPGTGRFVFVNRTDFPQRAAEESMADSVTAILLEGMRRYDELARAAAVVPDHARYRPTGRKPSPIAEEGDPDLVRSVWLQAAEGRTPTESETSLAVDSFRIRRLYEQWLAEGALEPVEED